MKWARGRNGRWPAHLDRATREKLGIGRRERMLGWGMALGTDGSRYPMAATDRALYGSSLAPEVPWDAFSKATWDEPILGLTATLAGVVRTERVELLEPGLLPAAVRTQVTESVVIVERLDLGQGRGARAIARRHGPEGEVRWTISFDPGTDPSDPQLRARADLALAELRSTLGI